VQKKIKAFLRRLSGSISLQCFSRQARGDPSGTWEEEVPIKKKNMWSTMKGAFLFISILIRKCLLRESILSPPFCPFCCL
jgi:hypothetical protein